MHEPVNFASTFSVSERVRAAGLRPVHCHSYIHPVARTYTKSRSVRLLQPSNPKAIVNHRRPRARRLAK